MQSFFCIFFLLYDSLDWHRWDFYWKPNELLPRTSLDHYFKRQRPHKGFIVKPFLSHVSEWFIPAGNFYRVSNNRAASTRHLYVMMLHFVSNATKDDLKYARIYIRNHYNEPVPTASLLSDYLDHHESKSNLILRGITH